MSIPRRTIGLQCLLYLLCRPTMSCAVGTRTLSSIDIMLHTTSGDAGSRGGLIHNTDAVCTFCTPHQNIYTRAGGGSQTFFSTHGNHIPSLSGVHGLKDFLHSDHLLEWFDVRIYTYGSVLKSNFYHQITQEDGHYGENPSNHELLTVRGGDCRASKKMFGSLLPP